MLTDVPLPSRKHRKAYSLIELLVAIVILALLLGLLIPGYQSVMESVRKGICADNLHQVGVIYRIYAQDNGGYFPPTPNGSYPQCFFNNGNYSIPTYYEFLLKYVPYTFSEYAGTNYAIINILFCPSFLSHTGCTPGKAFNIYLSGGYTVWAGFAPWIGLYHSAMRITDNPQWLIMGDTVVGGYNFNHIPYGSSLPSPTALGANWLYVDGHVDWVLMAQLTQTQTLGGGTYYLPPTPP